MADLIILDRNPLDDIRNTTAIESVMKNGRLYDGNTLNETWPDKKPLPTMFWQLEQRDFERLSQAGNQPRPQ